MLTKERNECENSGWILKKVADYSLLERFDCGNDDLNEFFRKDVLKQKEELLNETYALYEATVGNDFPVALISLCNDSVKKENIIELLGFKGSKKDYPFYPAVKIARFGVASGFQRKNIGSHIINMVKRMFLINNRTGCRLVTLDAYNKNDVLDFYKKNNFQFLYEKDKSKSRRVMFFDLKRLQI